MTLEEKLAKVDEKIWKQFERISDYAYRYFGYNKYDLARKCDNTAAIGLLSAAVYTGIVGTMSLPIGAGLLAGTAVLIPTSYIYYHCRTEDNNAGEKKEIELLLKTGAASAPNFGSDRPIKIIHSTALLTAVAVSFRLLSPHVVGNQDLYENLGLFSEISYAFSCIGLCSAYYFRAQIMQPPKAKINPVKALYEKAVAHFRSVPQPVTNEL